MNRVRALPAVLLSLLASSCESADELGDAVEAGSTPASSVAVVARPTLELAGCRHRVGSACHLPTDTRAQLHAWIDLRAGARLRLEIDGEPMVIDSTSIDGGQRLRITVEPTAQQIVLDGVDPPWAHPHVLDIVREAVPAVVAEAQRRIDLDDFPGALEGLRAGLDLHEGRERLEVLQLLRRVLGVGDPEALQRTEQAAELAATLHRPRDFVDAAASSAFIHLNVYGDLAKAREWTLRLEAEADTDQLDEGRVWARYYRGLLAGRSGDLTTSLRALDEARSGAQRLAMNDELLAIGEVLGPALAEVGRGEEALVVIRDTLALARAPEWSCEQRARSLNNIAWANLLLAQAGFEHDPPQPLLDEALADVAETGACPTPDTAAFVRVNAALAALAEHEPEEAATLVAELRHHELPVYLEPWVDEIAAQVGLATGRWSLVPALVSEPDPGGEPGLRFSAVVRHAHTLERLGFVAAAIDSHAAAEAILEASVSTLGIDLGRELFLAGRQASAVGLVELLVREGRVAEGLCRARLARGRALQSLDRAARIASLSDVDLARREQLLFDYLQRREQLAGEQRDDWSYSASERDNRESRRGERLAEAEVLLDEALRLVGGGGQGPRTCSELPPLGEGEVSLVHFPASTGSWLFIADHEQITVAAVPTEAAELGIEAALADAGDRLREATRIRVLPTGAAWSIPFHALRFDEGVLLEVAPVVYSLDLPRRPRTDDHVEVELSALVIANPSEDLPFAQREAERVSEQLRTHGWTVVRREGAEATRAALGQLAGQAELLHYAGHGAHTGTSGWDAALILHEGDELGVSDILALPRVPAGVVLTGCDTATVATDTLEGGMNLSRAFVLAGASWVIAAEGKVDDELALQIGEALYQRDATPEALDGAEALRRVQLELRHDHADTWPAFRVIVP